MERVQNNIEIMNDKKRRLDHEVSELFFINEGLRKNLSERDIKMIFKANLHYFKQIESGLEGSWRHKMYRNPNNKSKNEKLLKEKMIGAPFSDIQQEFIYKEVKKNWLKD